MIFKNKTANFTLRRENDCNAKWRPDKFKSPLSQSLTHRLNNGFGNNTCDSVHRPVLRTCILSAAVGRHTATATLFHQFICHSEGRACGAWPIHAQWQKSHRRNPRRNLWERKDSGEDSRNEGRREGCGEGQQGPTGWQENCATELRQVTDGEVHQECQWVIRTFTFIVNTIFKLYAYTATFLSTLSEFVIYVCTYIVFMASLSATFIWLTWTAHFNAT